MQLFTSHGSQQDLQSQTGHVVPPSFSHWLWDIKGSPLLSTQTASIEQLAQFSHPSQLSKTSGSSLSSPLELKKNPIPNAKMTNKLNNIISPITKFVILK